MTGKSPAKARISRHPLFPTVVALWFAALLGLGSLALRASLLEAAVRAVRLDLLIPAAAPPLGFTARLLVALLFAVSGGVAGFLAARALAPRRVRPTPPIMAAPPQPIVTPPPAATGGTDDNDDLARLAAARDGIPLRRRGLTAQAADAPFAAPVPPTVPAPSILNLGELVAVEPLGPAIEPAPTPAPVPVTSAPEDGWATAAAASIAPPAEIPASDAPVAPRFLPRDTSAADRLRAAPLDTLGVVELVERFALALAARRAQATDAAPPAPATGPVPSVNAWVEPAASEALQQSEAAGAMAEVRSTQPAAEPAPFADPNPSLTAGRPFDMPAMLRSPLPSGSVEWLGDDHTAAELALPPRSLGPSTFARPAPPEAAGDEEAAPTWLIPETDEDPEGDEAFADDADGAADDAATAENDALAERFSSLLDMKPSARALAPDPLEAPVRLPPPPTATGPAVVTEDALREALTTLQRMSGAA